MHKCNLILGEILWLIHSLSYHFMLDWRMRECNLNLHIIKCGKLNEYIWGFKQKVFCFIAGMRSASMCRMLTLGKAIISS